MFCFFFFIDPQEVRARINLISYFHKWCKGRCVYSTFIALVVSEIIQAKT